MPLPTAIRNLLSDMYDEADASPGKRADRRVAFLGITFKVSVTVEGSPPTIVITLRPRIAADGSSL